jgi:2-oxoglutarate dehydrogenase E2 component (dihydrolipoamide succinyltransferase)
MAQIEIRLPKMGESVTEATITNWLKNIGETVGMDEPLVEVATDKVDNELPSEAQGVLVKRFFEKDQVAQVGDVIAIISTDGGSNNWGSKQRLFIAYQRTNSFTKSGR